MTRLFLIAVLTAASSAAFANATDPQVVSDYAQMQLLPPTPSALTVCHGFGCRDRTEIYFTTADRAKLTQIMRGGTSSAEAERRAIATAVQWFDRRVSPAAGTVNHVARAGHDQLREADANFDCIDASRNTTSLLLVLAELHLLKYHTVEQTVARGAFIDLRWPHATAVVADLGSHKKWAVDSWTHAYGEKPDVKPLDVWLQEGGF